MRAPWLADVLRDAGLDPRVLSGWLGRGRDMDTIYGVVGHDTVTPSGSWSNARVDRLLRDGHANLSGPLSQLGVDFDARPVVIADGRCNHNGYGFWGNNSIGIEVYCGGGQGPEPWTAAQRETVIRMARAILDYLDLTASERFNPRVAGHKETDPTRKQDPHSVDMDAVRREVSDLTLTDEGSWFDMASKDELRDVVREVVRDEVARQVWGYQRSDDERDMASLQASGGLRRDELGDPHEKDHAVKLGELHDRVVKDEQ